VNKLVYIRPSFSEIPVVMK